MRFGVGAVLAILLGAFAAHFLLADRGYVLVNFRGYVVEMSVPGLVIVLVLAYLLIRALVAVADAPRRWRAAREQRRLVRRDSDLTTGLTQLIEGNWARSERVLTQGLKTRGRAARELPPRRPRGAAARRGRSARSVARARARRFPPKARPARS